MTWQEALSPAERRELLALQDWRAWLSIGVDWALVGALWPESSRHRERCRGRNA